VIGLNSKEKGVIRIAQLTSKIPISYKPIQAKISQNKPNHLALLTIEASKGIRPIA